MTGLVFAAAFFLCLLLALVRHPRYGIYAYLAAFYIHPPSRWWGASLPDFRWSLLASAVLFLAIIRRPQNPDQPSWLSTKPARLLIFFTALVWIQNLWALDASENLNFSILYTKYILLFYMIYRFADSTESIGEFLLAHVAGCLYLGILAFQSPGSGDRLDGVGGPGINDSNTLGMQFATAATCGAMIVLIERNWKLLLSLLSLAFILNGIVLCGSRGAFLSVVFGGLILVFTKPQQYKRLFYVLAVMGASLFIIVASGAFWERMNTMKSAVNEETQMDTSAESRIYIVKAQFQMFALHPFGSGHRGTVVMSRDFIAEKYLTRSEAGGAAARSSHNSFMSALAEEGVPGAVIFVLMIFWCRKAIREIMSFSKQTSSKLISYAAAVYAALGAILVAGLFADFIAVEVTIWMLAILASMHAMARKSTAALGGTPLLRTPQ